MKYARKRLLVLLAVLAMLLLAGCGGGQGDDVQKSDEPAHGGEITATPSEEATPEASPPAEIQPKTQEPADDPQPDSTETQPEESSGPVSGPEPTLEPALEPIPESTPEPEPELDPESAETVPEDGTYTASVTLEGGSGRATVRSPAVLRCEGGKFYAAIVWSSPNFDYMKVNGEKYLPTNAEGNSTFEIPVASFDQKLDVIADTVAMSEPHEVEYTLTFDSATLQKQ